MSSMEGDTEDKVIDNGGTAMIEEEDDTDVLVKSSRTKRSNKRAAVILEDEEEGEQEQPPKQPSPLKQAKRDDNIIDKKQQDNNDNNDEYGDDTMNNNKNNNSVNSNVKDMNTNNNNKRKQKEENDKKEGKSKNSPTKSMAINLDEDKAVDSKKSASTSDKSKAINMDKKKTKKRFFSIPDLQGKSGLHQLNELFVAQKFNSKSSAKENLNKLFTTYHYWSKTLVPTMTLETSISRIENLGRQSAVVNMIDSIENGTWTPFQHEDLMDALKDEKDPSSTSTSKQPGNSTMDLDEQENNKDLINSNGDDSVAKSSAKYNPIKLTKPKSVFTSSSTSSSTTSTHISGDITTSTTTSTTNTNTATTIPLIRPKIKLTKPTFKGNAS